MGDCSIGRRKQNPQNLINSCVEFSFVLLVSHRRAQFVKFGEIRGLLLMNSLHDARRAIPPTLLPLIGFSLCPNFHTEDWNTYWKKETHYFNWTSFSFYRTSYWPYLKQAKLLCLWASPFLLCRKPINYSIYLSIPCILMVNQVYP